VLKEELGKLEKQLREKETEMCLLKEKVDDLEQYSRRSCLRFNNIPEKQGEDTEDIVRAVAEAVGVTLPPEAVDRSHRIGAASGSAAASSSSGSGKAPPRQIIVKLTAHRYKEQLMRARRKLQEIDIKAALPGLDWSSVSVPRAHTGSPKPRVYINEDLTKERARIAARARGLKREKQVLDTWTRDGVIFVKRLDSYIVRLTAYRQLTTLIH
jgi:hypothetical protein